MKINENLVVQKERLPGQDHILKIDNFLAEPLDLSEKKFKSDTQLMPFPLGAREHTELNIPQLHNIMQEHLDVKTSKIDAEYVFTQWNDIDNYESSAFENLFEPVEVGNIDIVLKGDAYVPPTGNTGKQEGEPNIMDPNVAYEVMKEKGIMNHPARPIWDEKHRYHAILFLADHEKIQKANYNKVLWENPFPFTFFSSIHEDVSTYWWDDATYDVPNAIKHFYYYRDYRYHEWYLFTSESKEKPTFRLAEDNFHVEHALMDFDISATVDNIYNRLIIFPGWYYHAYQLQHQCTLDQLTLNMIID